MESLDLDQLVSVVGEYLPYMQGRLALAKGLGDHVVIQAGAEIREGREIHRDEKFNRSFRRFLPYPRYQRLADRRFEPQRHPRVLGCCPHPER